MLRINPELEIYEYGNEKYLVMDTKGYTNYDKAKVLGEYKTKERALEVLDEIQTQLVTLNYQYIHKGEHFIATESNVYEMPED